MARIKSAWAEVRDALMKPIRAVGGGFAKIGGTAPIQKTKSGFARVGGGIGWATAGTRGEIGKARRAVSGGALKLIEAARASNVSRYLMVSAIGVNHPDRWTDEMRPYYEAKADADAALEQSGLDWTIARPGMLTDGPGTGLVDLAPEEYGPVPRDDVALVLAECLDTDITIRKAFDIVEGETPAAEAVRALGGRPR